MPTASAIGRSRATWDYFANRDHTLTLGFLATLFEFDYSQSFNQQDQSNLYQRSVLASAYVQDEWQAGPTTRLRLGGRGTYFSVGDRMHFTPRMSLSHALSDKIRVKAAGGMYRQYLQLITTEAFSGGDFWVPLDSSGEPGRSYQGVVGTEWDPSRRYQLSVEAYYTDLANLVVLDNAVAVDSEDTRSDDIFKSGGSGWASGVEVFLQRAHWGAHRLGRLYSRLDAAHLSRTEQRARLSPQVRPPPRPVFRSLVPGGEMAPRLESRVCHRPSLHPGLGSLFATRADHRDGGRLRAAGPSAIVPACCPITASTPVPAASSGCGASTSSSTCKFSISTAGATSGSCNTLIATTYSEEGEVVEVEVEPEVIHQLPIVPTLGFNFSFLRRKSCVTFLSSYA